MKGEKGNPVVSYQGPPGDKGERGLPGKPGEPQYWTTETSKGNFTAQPGDQGERGEPVSTKNLSNIFETYLRI